MLNQATAAVWQAGRSLTSIFAARQSSPEPIQPRIIYMPRTEAGMFMSPDEALKLSAVWACCTVRADGLAASAWELFEERADGNRDVRRDLLTWRLLNVRPNPEMTAFAFRHSASIVADLWGNHFSEIERTNGGAPVALWPLSPERCCLERDEQDRLQLRVLNYTRGDVILPYRDVLHFHGPSVDGVNGLETFRYAARSWGHAAALELCGATFFSNNMQVSGVLKPTSGAPGIPEPQYQNLLDTLERRHLGPKNANKWLVLRGPLDFTTVSLTPEASQFIESRQHMVEEVARWFKVPPHKIQHLLRATFNNIEHLGIEFVRDSLTPTAEPMAQEADAKLLPFGNRRLYTRLDLDWLSEGDAKSRAEADSIEVNHGLATINEIRRRRGRNTEGPEADVLRTQMQYQPLGTKPTAGAGANRVTEPEPSQESEDA